MAKPVWTPPYCDTFWGSHGCSLDRGHSGPCLCITVFYDEDGQIEETVCDGNCAPPYFGPDTEFFSNHGMPTPEATLRAAHNGN